ncbi:hypothetical protein F5Y16DRAFT_315896 [Xylariaceae sp. FL0255]|nr:hypothetical protein F5Y16DRAFT_315896 [Xylariaceae sp. FL0255]
MQFTKFALAALSLGSAIAAPTKRASSNPLAVLNLAIAEVSSAESTIESEVSSITSALTGTVDVLKVESSLLTIGQTATSVLTSVLSLSDLEGLTSADLSGITGLVSDATSIVSKVKSTASSVTSGLGSEAISEVNSALAFALSTTGTITKPLISFIESAVPESDPIFNEVTSAVGELSSVANGLIAPVNSILSGVGLGL